MRYSNETKEKSNGVVYTPTEMADYLADQMIRYSTFDFDVKNEVKLLDPAVGEGELLVAMIKKVKAIAPTIHITATGYETDEIIAIQTKEVLQQAFPDVDIEIIADDFLSTVDSIEKRFDFIIANPPYIRTQILGAEKAQEIAKKWG